MIQNIKRYLIKIINKIRKYKELDEEPSIQFYQDLEWKGSTDLEDPNGKTTDYQNQRNIDLDF